MPQVIGITLIGEWLGMGTASTASVASLAKVLAFI